MASRYAVCFLGITILALGVALTARADLGTTPISSLPYVASLGFRPGMGFFTGLLNLALVGVQMLLLGRRFPRLQLLQIPLSAIFGFFIDVWLLFVPDYASQSYVVKMIALAVGTAALAVGIYMEIRADVVMMAGDGTVKALSMVLQKDFGSIKVCFDIVLVILGATLSYMWFSEFRGIGEGTLISAVCVGFLVKGLHSLSRYAR